MNEPAPSKQLMQKMNRLKVLDAIKRSEGITRPALARQTGLSMASITNIVSYLKARDVVSETEHEEEGKLGRKAALLRCKYTAYDVVCVKIETGGLTLSLTDLAGAVKRIEKKDAAGTGDAFTGYLREEIGRFVRSCATGATLAVGVAVSGLVLNGGDYVLSAALKWEASGLKRQLEEDAGLPVVIFNISTSNALFSCTATASAALGNVVFVDLDSGVGAIQLCRGRVNRLAVGEIGHTTVEKDGALCFCGNRGCLELMCSPERIISAAQAAAGQAAGSLAAAFEWAAADSAVRAAVDGCLEYLGIAVANVINVFLPEKVIINYADLYAHGYVHEYVAGCVQRRVRQALTGSVALERVLVSDADKLTGIAQYVIDTIFDLSFPGNIIA